MKVLGIAVLLVGITTTAHGQNIGALARAERKRQQEVIAVKTVLKEITPHVETAPPPEDNRSVAAAREAELVQLEREKSDLLMKLTDVIHDRKAVQDIEQRLGEIHKRAEELKQEAASTPKEAPAKEPKADSRQK